MARIREEKGLGIIDTLVTLVVIAVLIGVVIPRYQGMAQDAQETALRMSLDGIRKGMMAYVLINKRIPGDLRDLVTEEVILPVREDTMFTMNYLKSLALDDDGYPIDPYGNRYGYNPENGAVQSTTKGYEKW